MPFLVDSVTMEVNRHGLTLHLIIHPMVAGGARCRGTLDGLAPADAQGRRRANHSSTSRSTASPMPARLDALAADIDARAGRRAAGGRRLEERCGSARWPSSREVDEAARRRFRPTNSREGKDFLRWLADNHFTFLGYRCHELVDGRRRGRAEDRSRNQPRHPAREHEQGRRGGLRGAAAGSAGVRAPSRTAGRHQVDVALDRASAGLSRLHRGQALRRKGRGRAARIASSACSRRPPTAPIRPRFRCCGARSPTSSRARGSPPAATPARR